MATPVPHNHAGFTFAEVAAATGAELRGGAARPVLAVVIDSRAVTPGCLFVALRGERFDGHAFVADAALAGAGALMVERGAALPAGLGADVVEVEDTRRALGDLAAAHRRRWGGTLVAVTGSAGKTTTRELVAAALSAGGRKIARTAGNLNNDIGVPMTLLALDEEVETAVVELGSSGPGEIRRLARIAGPDVGLVTLVAAAHTEGLGSIEAVAREKASLFGAMAPGAPAVLNGDDPALERAVEPLGLERRLFFGRNPAADVCLVGQEVDRRLRTRCRLVVRAEGSAAGEGTPVEVRLRLLGEAAALDAAAALCVVLALRADVGAALDAMAGVEPVAHRMCPVRAGGLWVLDDTYNANPRSMAVALRTARDVGAALGGRVVTVLGDMCELGERSATEHTAVGRAAAALGFAELYFCGVEMAAAAEAARAQQPGLDISHVPDASELITPLCSRLRDGDVVLVKGSRSLAMERVVAALVEGRAA